VFRKLIYVLFCERKLLEVAAEEEYTVAHGTQPEFEARTRERRIRFRDEVARALRDVLLMLAAGAIFAAAFQYFCSRPAAIQKWLIIIGGAVAAFAVLGRVGWSIQTMEGNTLVERVNAYWFRLLYRASVTALFAAGFIGVYASN